MAERGVKSYELCMELDKTDQVKSREGLSCILIDEGRGEEARTLLDKYDSKDSAVLAYCRVILEYVSWEVLEEEGSSEVINPHEHTVGCPISQLVVVWCFFL